MEPSTPWSLHSRSFSGGEAKRQNIRAVYAVVVNQVIGINDILQGF